jgi:dienelactone hydrolase
MQVLNRVAEQGVVEERFDLPVEDAVVPGIIWSPENAAAPGPTILIGHGGTQHKRTPNVLGLARRFVRHLGYRAIAIDAPGHGDRISDPDAAARQRQRLEQRIANRTGAPTFSAEEAEAWVERSARGLREWTAVVDHILSNDVCDGRIGYWGVSMGTIIGLPFVAADRRVQAAVLGLAGIGNRPGAQRFAEAASALQVPILFVFQWDDELMSRDAGLQLFDRIGSPEKTMHINPGGHVAMPLFERDAFEAFFRRHLGAP